MSIFDEARFEDLKSHTENFYRSLGEVYCPYFQETVSFNAKGLEHLKFQSKHRARSREDQNTRMKLFHLAPQVIKLSRTIQGVLQTKNFEYVRSGGRTDHILTEVTYYEFIAILEDKQESKRVRVVVKRVGDGPRYFWSIIPFWKMDRQRRLRKMNSGNLETD